MMLYIFYKISWKCLERFTIYRAYTIAWRTDSQTDRQSRQKQYVAIPVRWDIITMMKQGWQLVSIITDTDNQDPIVQNIVNLRSLSVVKMLNVLVSRISNSKVFSLTKMWEACKSFSHFFFSKNISVYAIFNYRSFNDTLSLVLNNWA